MSPKKASAAETYANNHHKDGNDVKPVDPSFPHLDQTDHAHKFIRGVNLGGWLMLERYITPYTFAITDCHLSEETQCWYPGQIDAPPKDDPTYHLCTLNVTKPGSKDTSQKETAELEDMYAIEGDEVNELSSDITTNLTTHNTQPNNNNTIATSKHNQTFCKPVLSKNVFGYLDYPLDEWHLGLAFQDHPEAGAAWFNSHFEHFLTKQDLLDIKAAGITHLRVPLPHWIMGDIHDNEPWIQADRWRYFLRLCDWVREIGGLELWPNIHTAPGSQNGFDNSGVQNTVKTCGGWVDDPHNVQRSLDVLLEVSVALKEADVLDVVTGFGLLNEPFGDCNKHVYRKFLEDGITIIRRMLGDEIHIFMSDLFQASLFNDGIFGRNPHFFNNTFLDSHYYNIFAPTVRTFSPQEHVEHVCHPDEGENVLDCCYADTPANTVPIVDGTKRIVTEFTGAFDAMPGEVLKVIMKGIHEHGTAPLMDRQLSDERKSFLTKFIEAQLVTFEAADVQGLAYGWFYWNFKTEGGAYIEWDFCKSLFWN